MMAFTRPTTLLAATSFMLALTGCDNVFQTIDSYGEAGKMPESYHFGEANDNNQCFHQGQCVLDLANRFHELVPDTITFEFNSAALDENAMTVLRRQADFIRKFPEVKFRVYGHTDLVGSNAYNQGLGLRRAQAAVAYLVSHGAKRSQLQAVVSYGETHPVIATEDRERRNRRTVTEVSGFDQGAPLILNGKYAEVVWREYVESATEMPPSDDTGLFGGGGGGGDAGGGGG